MPLKSINSVSVKNKSILLRVDLNSEIKGGAPVASKRIRLHAQTIKGLSRKGARVVVLAHQGRKGQPDFVSLKAHAGVVSALIKKPVLFVPWEEDYLKAIQSMKAGNILFLDNTRFLKEEKENKNPYFVQKLALAGDCFCLDALSVAHRNHASITGFKKLLPCYAGPNLLNELSALDKARKGRKPLVLILGGAKLKDSLELLKEFLVQKTASRILLGGLMGELFLAASGIDLGKKEKFLQEKEFHEFIPSARALLKRFASKILLPEDVAVEDKGKRVELPVEHLPSQHLIKDIGLSSSHLFEKEAKKAKTIIFNGTMGVYEEEQFLQGTRLLLEAIAAIKCFSLVGGGDTETALELSGISAESFSYVSPSGKAFLYYLIGKKLPGLEALN